MTKSFLILLIAIYSSLFSGTVRLYNDSPYTLRVIVRGNDGSYLGELVMPAQNFSTWSDSQTRAGVFGKGNPYSMGPSMSQLPYTVMWYCMDGGDFSICNNVFTGSTVTAQTCLGTRICKPVPKQTPTNPNQGGQGEGLYTPPPPPTDQQVEEYPPP